MKTIEAHIFVPSTVFGEKGRKYEQEPAASNLNRNRNRRHEGQETGAGTGTSTRKRDWKREQESRNAATGSKTIHIN